MFKRSYKGIGEALRAVYKTDRKPLTSKIIDAVETLAETNDGDEQVRSKGAHSPVERSEWVESQKFDELSNRRKKRVGGDRNDP